MYIGNDSITFKYIQKEAVITRRVQQVAKRMKTTKKRTTMFESQDNMDNSEKYTERNEKESEIAELKKVIDDSTATNELKAKEQQSSIAEGFDSIKYNDLVLQLKVYKHKLEISEESKNGCAAENENKLKEYENQIQTLHKANDHLTRQNEQLQNENSQKYTEAIEKDSKIAELKKVIDDLTTTSELNGFDSIKYNDLVLQLESYKQKLEISEESKNRCVKESENQIRSLREANDHLTRQNEQLRNENSEKDTEGKEKDSKIAEQNRVIRDLTTMNEATAKKLDSFTSPIDEQVQTGVE